MVFLYKNPEFKGNPFRAERDRWEGKNYSHLEPGGFIELTGEWTLASIPDGVEVFEAETVHALKAEHSIGKEKPSEIAREMQPVTLARVEKYLEARPALA